MLGAPSHPPTHASACLSLASMLGPPPPPPPPPACPWPAYAPHVPPSLPGPPSSCPQPARGCGTGALAAGTGREGRATSTRCAGRWRGVSHRGQVCREVAGGQPPGPGVHISSSPGIQQDPQEARSKAVSDVPASLPLHARSKAVSDVPDSLPLHARSKAVSDLPASLPLHARSKAVSDVPASLPLHARSKAVSDVPASLPRHPPLSCLPSASPAPYAYVSHARVRQGHRTSPPCTHTTQPMPPTTQAAQPSSPARPCPSVLPPLVPCVPPHPLPAHIDQQGPGMTQTHWPEEEGRGGAEALAVRCAGASLA